jgi:TetR/AcrR family transcriptional regulator
VARPAADPARPASRARLLAAARAEFAARGFAGASVDRIAARARLNKAMIYYHFKGKDGLYRAVLREMFTAIGERARPLSAAAAPPADRMRAFIAAFVDEVTRRPDFAQVMLREIVESGRHLDAPTVEAMFVVPGTFLAILEQGVAQGQFRPVHPLLAYFSIVGPVVMTLASTQARARISRLSGHRLDEPPPEDLARQVQELAIATLGVSTATPVRARKSQP